MLANDRIHGKQRHHQFDAIVRDNTSEVTIRRICDVLEQPRPLLYLRVRSQDMNALNISRRAISFSVAAATLGGGGSPAIIFTERNSCTSHPRCAIEPGS